MIMSLKQKKVKFKPRIKFNHNMYIDYFAKKKTLTKMITYK